MYCLCFKGLRARHPCVILPKAFAFSPPQIPPLPRLNLRHMNVKRYPKYNTRKNSGFERRLRHTGLILDAQVTLQLLRKMLQPFVNRAVNKVVQHYMQDYIEIAVRNIRETLGEESVTEEDLRKFQWSIMRRVALQYFENGDLPRSLPADFSSIRPPSANQVPTGCVTRSSRTSIPQPGDPDWWHLSSGANSPLSSSNNTANHSPRSNNNNNTHQPRTGGSREPSPMNSYTSLSPLHTMTTEFKVPPKSFLHPPHCCPSVIESHPTLACVQEINGSSPVPPHPSPSSASSGSTLGFFHSDCSEPSSPSTHTQSSDPTGVIPLGKVITRQRLRQGPIAQSSVRHGFARKRPVSRWQEPRTFPFKTMRSTNSRATEENVQSGSSDEGSVEPWVSSQHPIIPHNNTIATQEQLLPKSAAPITSVPSTHSSNSTHSSGFAVGDGLSRLEFTSSTEFTLGSSANTWLGLGATRGRIYTKHPELFRYQCDAQDKSWLCQQRLLTGYGVKAYLMHADQVRQVGRMLDFPVPNTTSAVELQTFVLPPWMLDKLRAAASMDGPCPVTTVSHRRSGSSPSHRPPVHVSSTAPSDDSAVSMASNPLKVAVSDNPTGHAGRRQGHSIQAATFKPPQAPDSTVFHSNPAVVLIRTTDHFQPPTTTNSSSAAHPDNRPDSPSDDLGTLHPPTLQRFDYG